MIEKGLSFITKGYVGPCFCCRHYAGFIAAKVKNFADLLTDEEAVISRLAVKFSWFFLMSERLSRSLTIRPPDWATLSLKNGSPVDVLIQGCLFRGAFYQRQKFAKKVVKKFNPFLEFTKTSE